VKNGSKKWFKKCSFLSIFAQKARIFANFCKFFAIFDHFFLTYFTQTLQPNPTTTIFRSKTNILPKITLKLSPKTQFFKKSSLKNPAKMIDSPASRMQNR